MMLPVLKGKPVIRCSSLDQLLSCPGSRTLLEVIGALRMDDSDSWEGAWCHWEAARRLIEEHGAVPPEGGLKAPDIPKDFEPTSFAKWMVEFYLREVLLSAGSERAIEVECEMLQEFDRFWLSGHGDSNSVNADCTELDFDDLKTGINPVDQAESNWQVFGYAVLFKRQWPTLKRIRGKIVQPRMTEDVGKRVTGAIIGMDGCRSNEDGALINTMTIEEIAGVLEAHINAALDDAMRLTSGIKQCRWCDAWLKCPAIDEEIKEMKTVLLTQELLKKIKAEPDDAALARIALAAKLLDSKFESAREMLKARLEVEKLITLEDGTRCFIETKSGTREITKKETAWEILVDILPAEVLYELISLGVEPTERALAKHFKIPHKTEVEGRVDGRQKFIELLGDTVERKPQQWLQIVPPLA